MSTTKTRKRKNPRNTEPQNPEVATPGANQEPEASGKAATSGKGSRENVRIVSVAFPSRTARQLRLLSSVTGEPMASIVVGAVTRVIEKKLPDALAEITKTDKSPEGE